MTAGSPYRTAANDGRVILYTFVPRYWDGTVATWYSETGYAWRSKLDAIAAMRRHGLSCAVWRITAVIKKALRRHRTLDVLDIEWLDEIEEV